MTRDFMNREYELIVLDDEIRRICKSIDSKLEMYEIFKSMGDKQTAISYRISISALKRAASYIISRAEDMDLIDFDDWSVLNRAIANIGLDPEDRV